MFDFPSLKGISILIEVFYNSLQVIVLPIVL